MALPKDLDAITNKLFVGDCLDVMKKFPDEVIDLTVTSPPYDDLRSYDDASTWTFDKFKKIADELHRVTVNRGVVVWVTGDQTIKGGETGSSLRQALYFIDQTSFILHDTMIYQKSNFSNPSSNRYHQVFEYMFVFSKAGKPKTFNPIMDRPNVYAGKPGNFGENTSTNRDGTKSTRQQKINKPMGQRHNVWMIPTAGQDQSAKKWQHPAMFSKSLARDHIISWSNPGDIVFDPFGGSGTTALAAKELGRHWITCEINPTYVDILKSRIQC